MTYHKVIFRNLPYLFMKSKAKVVVVGGGAVGVSMLYHLAKKGWSDVVLVERKELTSGSTWHAAGLLPLFNMSYSVGQLHKYAVNLYKTLEKETGKNVGFSVVSNIRLASTKDRMDEYHQYAGVAQTIGVNVKFLKPEEIKEIWPLINTKGLIGAIQHPEDGYIQPADLTQALATGARNKGAEIYRNTAVVGIKQIKNGWVVETDKGTIECEHVVSCSGNFARQTGHMVGLNIPVIPVEHQYIVTESHPEIVKRKKEGLPEMGVLRDSDSRWYMREEAGGLILGPYEDGAPCCYVDGPSKDSEYELFQEDLERLAPHIEGAIHRVPAFGEVGVKKVYNGAICYTPDGNPIVGPAWGLKNFWINEGHSFGITAAGGAGWQLAEWIIDGEPTIDMLGVEPRRYGDYATKSYLKEKNEEAYRNVFIIHYPDEERPAGRPLRTAPCYERLKNLGAVFGQKFGWERANFFATDGMEQKDDWSFRRSNWFKAIQKECKNVKENVGILDMTAFAKCRIKGPKAEAFLDYLVANKLPKKIGRINLCHALNTKGGVHSEFTIMREADVDDFSKEFNDLNLNFTQIQKNKKLPFKDKEFDYVILSHVLEHVPNLLEFVSEVERISKSGYIELPTKLNDNLVFGCDEDDVGHKWWFEYDDIKNKLIYSEKVDVLEKFITVGQIWKFQKFFEDSFLLQVYWEEKINLSKREPYKFDKKIYFFNLIKKYFSKKLRSLISKNKN